MSSRSRASAAASKSNSHSSSSSRAQQPAASQTSTQRSKKRSAPDSRCHMQQAPAADVLRVLIATDTHLGYLEDDSIRGDDSFNSFEEVLQLAVANHVDFVLLGGDLFHDNKPSRATQFRASEILHRYVMGDAPIRFRLCSNPAVNFPTNSSVNYLDPNVNVALPIFSIHGNHDDACGRGALSSMDLMHQALLINYFGKHTRIDALELQPIVIEKGTTTLLLYGIGNVRDERLHNTFTAGQVRWGDESLRSGDKAGNTFNMCVVHQNRVKHSATDKNYLPESMLPSWLNFVLWGHEHECMKEPQENAERDFMVLQAGSSVATSLSVGESQRKHCSILDIKGNCYQHTAIPLTTVRPFVCTEIDLAQAIKNAGGSSSSNNNEDEEDEDVQLMLNDMNDDASMRLVRSVLTAVIQQQLQQIERNPEYQNSDRPALPLIRLRVDVAAFVDQLCGSNNISNAESKKQHQLLVSSIHASRFGQAFVGRVANAGELLMLSKYRPRYSSNGQHHNSSSSSHQQRFPDDIDACMHHIKSENDGKARSLLEHNNNSSDSADGDKEAFDTQPPIHDLVNQILLSKSSAASSSNTKASMQLLSQYKLAEAVQQFVDKAESGSISALFEKQLQLMQAHVKQADKEQLQRQQQQQQQNQHRQHVSSRHETLDIADTIRKYHDQHIREQEPQDEGAAASAAGASSKSKKGPSKKVWTEADLARITGDSNDNSNLQQQQQNDDDAAGLFGSDDSDNDERPAANGKAAAKPRAKAALTAKPRKPAAATTAARKPAAKRAKSSNNHEQDDENESEEEESHVKHEMMPPPAAGRRVLPVSLTAAGRRAPTAAASRAKPKSIAVNKNMGKLAMNSTDDVIDMSQDD